MTKMLPECDPEWFGATILFYKALLRTAGWLVLRGVNFKTHGAALAGGALIARASITFDQPLVIMSISMKQTDDPERGR